MKEYLRQLIVDGDSRKAIEELLKIAKGLTDQRSHKDTIMLSARYNTYEREERNGTTSKEELRIVLANINKALLEIIEQLPDDHFTVQPGSSALEPSDRPPIVVTSSTTNVGPNKKSIWLGIVTLISAGVLFAVMVIYQDSLGNAGPLGEMFFLLLLGILAGVAFFEFMPSKAEGDGKVFGMNLKFSGPILAGIAVAVGGYLILQNSSKGPFGFTVSLQQDKSLQIPSTYPPLENAKLLLRLGDEWKPAYVDSNGDASFRNIASDYRNKLVAGRLDARHWKLNVDSVKLTGVSQVMSLVPDGSLEVISGYVEDFKTGQRLENATIRVQGIETTSKKFGAFTLKLPLDKQLKFQKIEAYHLKYNDYEGSDVPIETKGEIVIPMKSKK